ncbi:response regulator [Acidovorax sp. SUPP3334]|uniref:response regulator n=1 Tax=Acidovorax sp. SUPP3334 TaxID=2920881 RepID=UPI0023DE1F0A|nr:response regulator [Acidovorax sp. SUPP3334]GKT26391.1 hypothetical protein AVHM3334_20855 [Acidovorax sp. SUPP3334]
MLLVDDNQDAAALLAEWLGMESHHIMGAYSAQKALTHLTTASFFDAAIFDIDLPEISGYELARQVLSQSRTRPLPLWWL